MTIFGLVQEFLQSAAWKHTLMAPDPNDLTPFGATFHREKCISKNKIIAPDRLILSFNRIAHLAVDRQCSRCLYLSTLHALLTLYGCSPLPSDDGCDRSHFVNRVRIHCTFRPVPGTVSPRRSSRPSGWVKLIYVRRFFTFTLSRVTGKEKSKT